MFNKITHVICNTYNTCIHIYAGMYVIRTLLLTALLDMKRAVRSSPPLRKALVREEVYIRGIYKGCIYTYMSRRGVSVYTRGCY